MKFRKKPVVIEAVQWNNLNRQEMFDFVGKELQCELESETAYLAGQGAPHFSLIIPTLEGNMKAMKGDWIIQGVNGEFYPCKPDIFAKTYEPASQPSAPTEAASELRLVAKKLLASKFWTYKARNGRDVSVEDEHGEKCYIVPSHAIEALEDAIEGQEKVLLDFWPESMIKHFEGGNIKLEDMINWIYENVIPAEKAKWESSTPPTATPEAAKEQGELLYRLLSPMEVGTEFPKGALITGKGVFIPTTTLPASTALNDGWISVEERLPEEPGEYICYFRYFERRKTDGFISGNKFYTDTKEWADNYDERALTITHWQPLPTPPKK